MRFHAFHSDPVVVNEFPSGLESHGFACFLPFANVVDPRILEVVEAMDFPIRAVLDGQDVGFHFDLEISQERLSAQGGSFDCSCDR
jgi:hypothetical protein